MTVLPRWRQGAHPPALLFPAAGAGVPGEMEPETSLEGPGCKCGERPPEGSPVPNNTHPEQAGDAAGFQASSRAPTPTGTVTPAGCPERALAVYQALS